MVGIRRVDEINRLASWGLISLWSLEVGDREGLLDVLEK